jgi:hypothetical protein
MEAIPRLREQRQRVLVQQLLRVGGDPLELRERPRQPPPEPSELGAGDTRRHGADLTTREPLHSPAADGG